MSGNSEPIVSTGWLADHLYDPNIAVLDTSWHMPADKRDAQAEFLAAHIPGAQFFDIDKIADASQGLPHMLPTDEMFATTMAGMGIGNETRVVVYDAKGLFSAPRVWWTLRVMGVTHVSVLDGGLPKWRAEGRPVEVGEPGKRRTNLFQSRREQGEIWSLSDMRRLVNSGGTQIVDARPAARFTGEQPEPRPGLAQGHMPGARNVPFTQLVNADGTLKSAAELRIVMATAGVNPAKPVVASCGSGVTACLAALALAVLGNNQTAVYDGSWAEWGRDPANPVAKGPAT